jgi:hypothetical protein
MSETFPFDVSYATTFDQLETLRGIMLEFVKRERRDFFPIFDVTVVGAFSIILLFTDCSHQSISISKTSPDKVKCPLQLTLNIKATGNKVH